MADRARPYIVKSLVHASKILQTFQSPGEVLRLRDIVERTGFGKGMCFRLLHTLHHCGFVEKVDERRYRLTNEIRPRKRYRIGYASQGQDSSFPREVHAGLVRAAEREHLELIVVDNRYQAKVAVRNAEHLIKEKVDLVIEFQTDEAAAPAIASKYLEADIPLIAIDIPHPGATYFGANNYQAGLLAGRPATSYWNALGELAALDATIEIRSDDRFVDDGDIITSAGVSAGIDMALLLAARIAGDRVAEAIQLGIEYDPDPPFATGSPATAPPELVDLVRQAAGQLA